MKPTIALTALLTVAILSTPAVSRGQQAPAGNAVDKAAMDALNRMGTYLRTLKSFQVQSTTSTDDVLDDGQKVSSDGTVDLLVQRPNRMRVEIESDAHHRMFFYDGKVFSIFAMRMNYYATVPAPGTLADLIDELDKKYDIEVPLVDLFYWGGDKSSVSTIKSAVDVGPGQVLGTTCEHYAYRQDGLDWQIWVQAGDFPLPRKLVLTTTDNEARPTHTSVLTWNLAPSFNDAAFTFDPPSDAHKINLTNVKP
ncbi:MAG TPA: DUF2092 domain-containing protein [Vicinamibacterales bacterium]|jgi:hypothetical protein